MSGPATNLRDVDLNLLVVLAAIRDTGSVTAAGEHVGLTQSGSSRALARLRDALGDPLFVADRGRLTPTARCRELSGHLDTFLASVRSIVTPRTFDPRHATGTLRIGMPDHLAFLHGPTLLDRLGREAPQLDVVTRAFSRDWLRELRDGDVDLTFGVLRGDEAGVRTRGPGPEDPWVVLLRTGHPALRGRWTARRFAEGEHGLMTVGDDGPSHVDRALRRLGLSRRVRYRSSSPLVVALAAARSDLRVTTTQSLARALAASHPLIVRRLPADVRPEPLRLALVWHERAHLEERNAWARALVDDVVRRRARRGLGRASR